MIDESSRSLYRGAQVVWYVLFLVQGLLAVRFAMKALQANPDAVFTSFIYAVSDIFVYPFVAVFQNVMVDSSVFEWTTLLAMVVYWLLALAIVKLFVMGKPISRTEADHKLVE